ncbi:MAG: tetratricopeptide repeat protein, partial [Planctomycetes bacterium]|nr:tetratricopeptide repeat protein [Planctomycetota bacterium]
MQLSHRAGLITLLALGAGLAPASAADVEKAAAEFSRGQALLQSHDFDGALAAFAAAVKANPDDESYRQEHALLRRIIPLRARLDKQAKPEKWQSSATALRSYYVDHGLLDETLTLDEEAHRRFGDADTASRLADTQIKLGRDDAAVQTLTALPDDRRTPQVRVQLGIALAHGNRLDEAR